MNDLLNFQDIVDRAKKAFKINEDKELSDIIGMSNQAFYNRKKTRSVPYDELLLAANRRNIDFNWLLTGEGDMYKHVDNPPVIPNRRLQMMLKIMEALPEKQQDKILSAAEDAERLNDLEQKLSKLTERLSA